MPADPNNKPFPFGPPPTPPQPAIAVEAPTGDGGPIDRPTVINVLPADPKLAEPLPDAEITEILDGMMIPNEESSKRMAEEIEKDRGGNPKAV